jgi:choline dehydrogenase-like flavoprotein
VGPLTLQLLEAVVARLMPWDAVSAPGGPRVETPRELAKALSENLGTAETEMEAGLLALDGESNVRHRLGFLQLDAAQQDALLSEIEQGSTTATWILAPHRWFQGLLQRAAEARYANLRGETNKAVWSQLGYAGFQPAEGASVRAFSSEEPSGHYDVVVIGAGIAGSIVAGVLADGGQRVLLLERGDDAYQRALSRDHLRNHRLSLYGHNTGPELEGHPRTLVDPSGRVRQVLPHQSGYHNNAVGVGGGGVVFGAQAWRFRSEDFQMQSLYGKPAQSSLADWPIRCEELAPYYERVEWGVGVSGPVAACFGAPPGYCYPMPALPGHAGRGQLERGATALGWQTHGIPLLINSVPYLGRSACVRCNSCVGFACPSDAKNGGHNTFLRRGIGSGNLTLVTRAFVSELATDARGRVVGVHFYRGPALRSRSRAGSGSEPASVAARLERIKADRVVLCCGAIESARLLLASRTSREPAGIGNRFDQVGRHLQGHIYVTACGQMPEPVENGLGPGVSIATTQFMHRNPDIIGGGLLADDFVLLPIIAWREHLPPNVPRWGLGGARWLRDNYRFLLKVTGPIQEIPSPESRVTLDPDQTDRFGRRVARLSGSVHPESVRSAEFLRQRAEEWLRAAGARQVWSRPTSTTPFLSAGQHQAGTCRMGTAPESSVTDPWGRVHGHDNLFVIDASTHVTNGGVNPALTIMALALRNASGMLHGTA